MLTLETKMNTKKRKKTATEKPRNPNSKALIDEGLAGSFDDDCWGDIAHYPNIPYLKTILRGYKTEEREQFLTRLDLARNYWYCDQCDYVYKNLLESDGDYILCHGCFWMPPLSGACCCHCGTCDPGTTFN